MFEKIFRIFKARIFESHRAVHDFFKSTGGCFYDGMRKCESFITELDEGKYAEDDEAENEDKKNLPQTIEFFWVGFFLNDQGVAGFFLGLRRRMNVAQ